MFLAGVAIRSGYVGEGRGEGVGQLQPGQRAERFVTFAWNLRQTDLDNQNYFYRQEDSKQRRKKNKWMPSFDCNWTTERM